MVTGGLLENARSMFDTTAFGIGRAKIEPSDPGQGNCRGAHGAGFQGHVKIAAKQTGAAKDLGRLLERDKLGMGRCVREFFGTVAGNGQDLLRLRIDDQSGDRHLLAKRRFSGFGEGQFHIAVGR